MTIRQAADIVRQAGPCRIAIDRARHPVLATELRLLGCAIAEDGPADVAVAAWGEPRASAPTLALIAPGLPRQAAEARLALEGWGRHPASLALASDSPALPEVAFFAARETALAGDEAALRRHAIAGRLVRPGDRVLVVGPDAAAGAALLRRTTRAGHVVVDADEPCDMVVALDPPGDWAAAIADAAAPLKPDGRLVIGWPEARGPAGWEALAEVLDVAFLTEARHADGGWRIAVASADPIGGAATGLPYAHPQFGAAAPLVDFAGGYDNPWLYRTMVQMGERIGDEGLLARLAEYVAGDARGGSADQGAALAVLGYRLLENRATDAAPLILPLIAAHRDAAAAEAGTHAARWRLSLAYLAGRLSEMIGDRDAARARYAEAAGDGWAAFAPILATKAVGARFFLGRLALADGNVDAARGHFAAGVETSLAAARADHRPHLGDPARPLAFYLTELAEVIDMGSQCANALAHLHLWARDRGLFWRQVDVKRFGLASWAGEVARENERLRALLAARAARRAA